MSILIRTAYKRVKPLELCILILALGAYQACPFMVSMLTLFINNKG